MRFGSPHSKFLRHAAKGCNKIKIASFFAGVGGIELGFNQFQTIYANEIDPRATLTYEKNFEIKVDCRNILNVDEKSIPNFDILLGGFPCQAFSIAGYQLGFMIVVGICFLNSLGQ